MSYPEPVVNKYLMSKHFNLKQFQNSNAQIPKQFFSTIKIFGIV